MHWHRLGEQCGCGHLAAPARFYADDATQKQAEAAYLEFLKEHMPERWAKLVVEGDMEAMKVKVAAFHAVTGRLPGHPHPRPRRKATGEEPSERKPHTTKVPSRLRRK